MQTTFTASVNHVGILDQPDSWAGLLFLPSSFIFPVLLFYLRTKQETIGKSGPACLTHWVMLVNLRVLVLSASPGADIQDLLWVFSFDAVSSAAQVNIPLLVSLPALTKQRDSLSRFSL